MADGARVQDTAAIRIFRAAVIKFIEASNAALIDAEGELTKRVSWLEGEQSAFWQGQIKKLTEVIGQLKEQIRMKKLFKDSSGRTPSAFDEEKKLRFAQQKFEIAEQKLANCRRWAKQLQREHLNYRGGVQRLSTMLQSDLINGVATLDKALAQLEAYLAAGAPQLATSEAGGPPTSMAQSADANADGGTTMQRPVETIDAKGHLKVGDETLDESTENS